MILADFGLLKGVSRVNEKQLLAFELYYSQGLERSYSKLAKEIKVSKNTVVNWAKKFKWQDLIKERDKSDADKLRDEVFKAKILALKVICAGSQQILSEIESGNQKVLVADYPTWIKSLGNLDIGEAVKDQSACATPDRESGIEIKFDIRGGVNED